MKKILLLICLLLSVVTYSQVKLGGTISQTSTADNYPTHADTTGFAGYRVVADTFARNNLKSSYREIGMIVYCRTQNKTYQLIGGTTNNYWTVYSSGSTSLFSDVLQFSGNAYKPYGTQTTGGRFDSSATFPVHTNPINWDGNFNATNLGANTISCNASSATAISGSSHTVAVYGDGDATAGSVGVNGISTSNTGIGGSFNNYNSGVALKASSVGGVSAVLNNVAGISSTSDIMDAQFGGTNLFYINYNGIANYVGNRHSYFTSTSLTDKKYVDSVATGGGVTPTSDVFQWVTNAYKPYGTQTTGGRFDSSATAPTHTNRINWDGYLYAKKLYSAGSQTLVSTDTTSLSVLTRNIADGLFQYKGNYLTSTISSLLTFNYDGDEMLSGNTDLSKFNVGSYTTGAGTLAGLINTAHSESGDFSHYYFLHNVATPSNGIYTTTYDNTSTSYVVSMSDVGYFDIFEAPATGGSGAPVFASTPTFSINMITGNVSANGISSKSSSTNAISGIASTTGNGGYFQSGTGVAVVANNSTGNTSDILDYNVNAVTQSGFNSKGIGYYNGNKHSYFTSASLTDKAYVDSMDALHVSGTGANTEVSYWNGTSSQTGSANFLFDGTNINLALGGTSTEPNGVSTSDNTVLSLLGKATASNNARGILSLTNNRVTSTVNDIIGTILFNSLNNGSTPTLATRNGAKIESILVGSGGTNGFGAQLAFYTKADNTNSLTNNMTLYAGGSISANSSNNSYSAFASAYFGTLNNGYAIGGLFYGGGSNVGSGLYGYSNAAAGSSAVYAVPATGSYGLQVNDANQITGTQTYDLVYLVKSPSSASQHDNGNFINMQSTPVTGGTTSGSAIYYNCTGVGVVLNMNPEVPDGATAIAYTIGTKNNLVTSGAKLLSLQNNLVEKYSIDKSGNETVASITSSGNIVVGATSANSITAGTGITSAMLTSMVVKVAGNGGAVVITASPQIAAGTDNQIIMLEGTSNSNTVTISNGTGLSLDNGVNFTLGNKMIITLKYSVANSVWEEVSRSANQ